MAEHTVFFVSSSNVHSYDIESETFSQVSSIWSGHPAADGSIVIWTEYGQYPSPLLQGKDISTGQVFDIVSIPGGGILHTQQATEIDGMLVAWTKTNLDFSDMDIFVTELVPEPATLSLLALAPLALLRRRRR